MRVCVISHSHYPYDSRVSRQARALVQAGHDVDVICLRFEDQPFFERLEGVSVYHLPIGRLRGGALRYFFEFVSFQLAARSKLECEEALTADGSARASAHVPRFPAQDSSLY